MKMSLIGIAGVSTALVSALCLYEAGLSQSPYMSERQGYAEGCKQTNSKYHPDRVNPHWAPVGRSNKPAEIRGGLVVDAYMTHTDFPLDHNSHDFCFKVWSPKHLGLLSDANEDYGTLDDESRNEGQIQQKVIECEWESAEFPETFWPQIDDEVLFVIGRHVWDCGHPPLKTEIHPPQAVAFARPEIRVFGGDSYPSFGKKALVYIHGGGGYYSTNAGGRSYEFEMEVPLYGQIVNLKKNVTEFDFKVEIEQPFGGPSPEVTHRVVVGESKAIVKVRIPLEGVSDPSGNSRYGLIVYAGWREKTPSVAYDLLRYTFDTLTLYEDHDPGLRADGEWNLWVYAGGSYHRFDGTSDMGDDDKGHSHWLRKSCEILVQRRLELPWDSVTTLRNITEELQVLPPPLNRIRTTGWEDDCDSYFGIKEFGDSDAAKYLEAAWSVSDIIGTAISSENDRIGIVSDFRRDREGLAPPFGQVLLSQLLGANVRQASKPLGGEEPADDDTDKDFALNFRIERIRTYLPPGAASRSPDKLVIDKIIMHETPQSGTWLFAFDATANGNRGAFHIPDKEYEHDPTDITMRVGIEGVPEGQVCSFRLFLDDDEDSVAFTQDAEDRTSGAFVVTRYGQQTFSTDDWTYTVYWHLE